MSRQRATPSLLVLTLLFLFQTIDSQTHTTQEAFDVLGISWNSDNTTVTRVIQIPMVNATPSLEPDQITPPIAFSKDVYIDTENKAYVRMYTPSNLAGDGKKLPLIVYFHGGDFVLFSASTVIFHNFCNEISSQFPAIVVSVEYRLAPESQLPAAYDDAMKAILWVRSQARQVSGAGVANMRDRKIMDEKNNLPLENADFSRVFLMGSSAGANIAYNVALRAIDSDLRPMTIKGLLLNQPFFGGVLRTPSEKRLKEDVYVALYVNDVLWTLALPENLDRDSEYCNPVSGGSSQGRVKKLPKVYVKGDYGDPLVDRATLLVKLLRSYKIPVVYQYGEGGYHGIEFSNRTAAQELYDGMKKFVEFIE